MLQQQENIWKTESFSQELKNKPQQTVQLIFLVESHACAGMLSCYSCVQLCVTLWAVTHQAPLSMGFSRQEYWSGLPRPPPEDLNDPGIEPPSPASPALAGRFFTTSTIWKASAKSHAAAATAAKSLQSCPTLCDPIDSSPPGSSIPGILQAKTLEWVAISFSNA